MLVSGCQTKSDVERQREAAVADAEREVPQPATATLKRTPPFTSADRAGWRALLQWPETCDAGLSLHAAGAGITIVEVGCNGESGASPSHLVIRFDERGSSPVATVLKFPVVASADHQPPLPETASRPAEAVTGELFVAADGHTLSLLTPARPSRDCGTWTRYSITGEHPRIVAASAQLPCPTPTGPAVAWRDGESPAGWRPLDVPR